jgi:SulP family sulfate permease
MPLGPRADRIGGWVRARVPPFAVLRRDAIAGIPGAISSVPDGMAASVLAGVSPVHGLYASAAGPVAGGLTSSTQLMVVTTTSASALAAGSTLSRVDPADRSGAVALLALFAGCFMIAAALLRAGRYTRFVSHSVMTGFLTGVAANMILGQVADFTGAAAHGSFALAKAVDVLTHPGRINIPSVLTGAAAIAIMLPLARTRLAPFSALLALFLPTLAVVLTGADSVTRVADLGAIPHGFPLPAIPDFGQFSLNIVTGAAAVAVIVLVQGAGVSQSAPNRDETRSDANRDFLAQGVGGLASAVFKGQPVGGSVGQTALNIAAGARSRWAGIMSGLWMVVILLLLSGVIGKVALPTLAAILMVAGAGAIRPALIMTILRTGTISQIALITTFLATLFLPVAAAVGIGVALSLLLQLNRDAMDLRVVSLVPTGDGALREQPAPTHLPSRQVTLLDVYGSLLYAGSRTLQARLPDPAGSQRPAVILRLRGRTQLGSTFFAMITDYEHRLADVDGRLFLSGLDPQLAAQFGRILDIDEQSIGLETASNVIGESSLRSYRRAQAWIEREHEARRHGRATPPIMRRRVPGGQSAPKSRHSRRCEWARAPPVPD